MPKRGYDAVIVGAGQNGLSAAVTLAEAGRKVLVLEGQSVIGGGARSEEVTLPGFVHDICSTVHPLGITSPAFRRMPLEAHGLRWIQSPAAVAHPLDGGRAAILERSVRATAALLGRDGPAYRALFGPLAAQWAQLAPEILRPIVHLPRHPILLARFGLPALLPANTLARLAFREEPARALFGGIAAHATLPLDQSPSAAFCLVLALAGHAVGWPIAAGGSRQIVAALASYLRSLGGEIVTDSMITDLGELPPARATLLDITPAQFLKIAGDRLPDGYRQRLSRYRYGLGTFKVDWALDGPVPWRAPECRRAATVHLGGILDEMVHARHEEVAGRTAERPLVLFVQPTLFDRSRAPAGKEIAWGYCHVPLGSNEDMTARIEAQVERFAPGFRDRIIARKTWDSAAFEQHNPNLVGGDIGGGETDLGQLLFRPLPRFASPYATPLPNVYLCSASTPPGGGVHGMGGHNAARVALRQSF